VQQKIGDIIMGRKATTEKDLSMDNETWEKRTGRITEWIDLDANQAFLTSNEDIEDAVDLIRMNIKRGNRTADKRKNLWNQILIEGRDWTTEQQELLTVNWPVAVGKESSLPPHVQESIKAISDMVESAYADFWNNNPIVQQITVISDRNKELGGSPFETSADYADGKGLAIKQRFTKYFNDKRWDGAVDLEAGFNISPPHIDEEEVVITEEEVVADAEV
tara:strand:- start:1754 stop:2413 length:660 start_codon:yes stop_codon:yes gene_type:complete